MKVSIDAFNIALEHGTGVATYARNLAKAGTALNHDVGILFGTKAKHSNVALLNEIALAEGEPTTGKVAPLSVRMRRTAQSMLGSLMGQQAQDVSISGQVILPPGLRLDASRYWNVENLYDGASQVFRMGGAFTSVKLGPVDVAHWTYPLPIKAKGACNVYTLHDLVPLRLPYTTADRKRTYYRLCRRIARQADHILTVSECSRRDIVEILGIDERRVTNLFQSSDVAEVAGNVEEAEIGRYVEGLLDVGMRDYFLFFGAIEPKKNIARMIEAYLGSASGAPLVIVGAPGWGSERDVKLLKSMASLDTRRRIIWLGYLPREMLVMLIAGARAILFPSLYEGFGLPVLEAMSLGTPVITSDTSSMPEVAGEAGLLVDPYDVKSIATAIMALDRDRELCADLSTRSLEQAKHFSASAYRQRLADFYGKIG